MKEEVVKVIVDGMKIKNKSKQGYKGILLSVLAFVPFRIVCLIGLLAIIFTLSFSVCTYAEDILWEELINKSYSFYQEGQYLEAENLLNEALKVAKNTFGSNHFTVVVSLHNLAEIYKIQGEYSKAESIYKRALSIAEKTFSDEHPIVAVSLNFLAELYSYQGKNTDAELLYKQSLQIYEKTIGPDHHDVAVILQNIAKFYKKIGKKNKSKNFEERAEAILSKNSINNLMIKTIAKKQ
jgi:tetratricopeptide (TPR) repeat protein